ncbi:MAG: GTPase HflX [Candidatus Poribacteria bacterium]|nr:GTPase HflX [Candidatus Poribacteria bacterium]MDE0505718.1 GTPase HflX [Candidatus Poribacteria bacterium]
MNLTVLDASSQRVILVGVKLANGLMHEVEDSLAELEQLATTAGMRVVGEVIQTRESPNPTYFIGQGKIGELQTLIEELHADAVIFDDDLTPAQTRNIEAALDVVVVDRTGLILEIFRQRAQTREATLQVDLARLEYALPRLTRMWSHLSRQATGGGGRIGGAMRGEGETQLQTDRRLVRREISKVKKLLQNVEIQRRVRRHGRTESANVSLVGYTNAGKSTLFNKLTGEHKEAEDKLFATLDSTTRVVKLPSHHRIFLSDTVGFIKKLPHHLIAAFKATLDEVAEAKLLLHVVDVSHPQVEVQISAVNEVLRELGASEIPMLMVFNKIDCLEDEAPLCLLRSRFPESVNISAQRGDGLDVLRTELTNRFAENDVEVSLNLPYSEGKKLDFVYKNGEVLEVDYQGVSILVKARVPERYLGGLRQFMEAPEDYS